MSIPLNDIKGKVCVITGGGGVIGTSFALGLAEAGAKVAILDFKKENSDAVAQK
jgi:NAD(P)-dependent dehydrogenase (short-subunit alcohol dehydrogenase family)